ncbi:MAG TPA: hypothetical protein VFT22_08635, partial [Kofleriaceae bacterium]|nr:hypothetical protein [Kofleriaceae bacterium]
MTEDAVDEDVGRDRRVKLECGPAVDDPPAARLMPAFAAAPGVGSPTISTVSTSPRRDDDDGAPAALAAPAAPAAP